MSSCFLGRVSDQKKIEGRMKNGGMEEEMRLHTFFKLWVPLAIDYNAGSLCDCFLPADGLLRRLRLP